MTNRYFLPDKTFRKFMNFLAKDFLQVFTIRDCKGLPVAEYTYFDDVIAHKHAEKREELNTLFREVGLDFERAYHLVNSDLLDFDDFEKGLRKIIKRYYPESMREKLES